MLFDNPTTGLVARVLDIVATNHNMIANNIANVNTPDYKASRIDFETVLARVEEVVSSDNLKTEDLSSVNMDAPSSVRYEEGTMLDNEMVKMAENAMKYQALIGARNELSSLLSMAIKGRE